MERVYWKLDYSLSSADGMATKANPLREISAAVSPSRIINSPSCYLCGVAAKLVLPGNSAVCLGDVSKHHDGTRASCPVVKARDALQSTIESLKGPFTWRQLFSSFLTLRSLCLWVRPITSHQYAKNSRCEEHVLLSPVSRVVLQADSAYVTRGYIL